MKAVLQRVLRASVSVDGKVIAAIEKGLLVFIGIGKGDSEKDAETLAKKISELRMFDDKKGHIHFSVKDVGGEILVVSQFTLYGDCRRGRRPSFDAAAPLGEAQALYEYFVQAAREKGISVETGIFQASMAVELVNEGPVTILLDSTKLF